ncbi:MAG TPA: hypothetical protein VFM96_05880 [Gaiellaceae bacterium]|nr:hypothetical protein [Gaiellaceae bacterium]
MPKVDLTVETTLSFDAVRGALLDFSERRPEIWPGLTPSLYEVYSVGETSAEVKEGTKMPMGTVWAKERYDWSEPRTIRWTVLESNFCTPGSYVSATLGPREGGGTLVEIHWERTGTTVMGRLVARLISLTNGKPVAASVEKAFRKLERASAGGRQGT